MTEEELYKKFDSMFHGKFKVKKHYKVFGSERTLFILLEDKSSMLFSYYKPICQLSGDGFVLTVANDYRM